MRNILFATFLSIVIFSCNSKTEPSNISNEDAEIAQNIFGNEGLDAADKIKQQEKELKNKQNNNMFMHIQRGATNSQKQSPALVNADKYSHWSFVR